MISLQTNVSSLIAQNNLRVNNDFANQTIERMTSGFRINQSGDDAAGLAVANMFRANIAELSQGVRNANDALSLMQIIDGGLNNISHIMDRLKTLATQSASDTFTGSRTTLDDEFGKLVTEIDRQADNIGLGSTTSTNAVDLGVYIGGGSGATVSVDLTSGQVDSTTLAIGALDISTAAGAATALTAISAAIGTLGGVQGTVGAGENTMKYAIQLAQSQIVNYSAAESRIRDADVAAEAANLTKAQVLQQASLAAMAQANAAPQAVLALLKG